MEFRKHLKTNSLNGFGGAEKILFLMGIVFFLQCTSEQPSQTKQPLIEETNPASADFDWDNSDAKAIKIADAVMKNMGGRKAWDDTKIIKWNFFNARKLTWNKQTGDVRIDFPENDSTVFITNIFTHQGKIKLSGKILTQTDSVEKYTKMAESIWINDAYWLFMPFKLKDSKTTLKYININTTENGVYSHQLQLTFNEIGDTPENKYYVYVDTATMLVNQWTYFSAASDTVPRFKTPWADYQPYGNLLLAGDRGERRITEIEVLDSIAASTFIKF